MRFVLPGVINPIYLSTVSANINLVRTSLSLGNPTVTEGLISISYISFYFSISLFICLYLFISLLVSYYLYYPSYFLYVLISYKSLLFPFLII
jgi:hypothetical protein